MPPLSGAISNGAVRTVRSSLTIRPMIELEFGESSGPVVIPARAGDLDRAGEDDLVRLERGTREEREAQKDVGAFEVHGRVLSRACFWWGRRTLPHVSRDPRPPPPAPDGRRSGLGGLLFPHDQAGGIPPPSRKRSSLQLMNWKRGRILDCFYGESLTSWQVPQASQVLHPLRCRLRREDPREARRSRGDK